jgi:hypothetical protein
MIKFRTDMAGAEPGKLNIWYDGSSLMFQTFSVTKLSYDYERLEATLTLRLSSFKLLTSWEKIKLHKSLWIKYPPSDVTYYQEKHDDLRTK